MSGSFRKGLAANAVAAKGTKRVKDRILKRVDRDGGEKKKSNVG